MHTNTYGSVCWQRNYAESATSKTNSQKLYDSIMHFTSNFENSNYNNAWIFEGFKSWWLWYKNITLIICLRNGREELPRVRGRVGDCREELPCVRGQGWWREVLPRVRGQEQQPGGTTPCPQARGQGRRQGGPTPSPRSCGCAGAGGPRGAVPCWRSKGAAVRR